jgi:hypothetical protein
MEFTQFTPVMKSDEFGEDYYSTTKSLRKALSTLERLARKVSELNDGIERSFFIRCYLKGESI